MNLVAFRDRVRQRLLIRSRMRRGLWQLRCSRFGLAEAQNIVWDLRYGGYCGGKVLQGYRHPGAYRTQSTHYMVLGKIFRHIPVQASDVLVDVGCGKGRVINYWLSHGYTNDIIGIDVDDGVAAETRKRLAPFSNVTILSGSALENLPERGSLFYLYNPFDGEVFRSFMRKLANLSRRQPDLRVVYYVPRHVDILSGDPEWEIRELPMGFDRSAMLILPCVQSEARKT
jgi:hypothetical protein